MNYRDLSSLEEKLHNYLSVVETLIKTTNENIDNLNEYINKRYNDIKVLASKKPTRINWMKSEDRMHMSLFFDKKKGFAPSNEDALKICQFQSNFSNYRKKYEYKKNIWTKKGIDMLSDTVNNISKKYAIEYLIDPNLKKELQIERRKEIEGSDAKHLLSKIKLYFDEKGEKEKKEKKITKGRVKHKKPYTVEISSVQEKRSEINNSNAINDENVKIVNDCNKLPHENTQINNYVTFSENFWYEVSESLNNSQNLRECQKTWLYYGCFENEKKAWTNEEINNLLFLCKKYNNRKWKQIARELNTNRSPLSCFEKYIKINKIYAKKETIKLERIAFNVLEDIQLQILVSIIGDKNWYEIKKHMENLNSNIKRIEKRKSCHITKSEKKEKKFINDEISYKRRYLRLVNAKKDEEA